jgi:hypothetical protein
VTRHRSLRTELYRAARDLGDVESAAKGPGAFAGRRVRKVAYRRANGLLRGLLRSLGL